MAAENVLFHANFQGRLTSKYEEKFKFFLWPKLVWKKWQRCGHKWGKNIFLVIWTKQIMLEDDPTEQEFHFLQCQR